MKCLLIIAFFGAVYAQDLPELPVTIPTLPSLPVSVSIPDIVSLPFTVPAITDVESIVALLNNLLNALGLPTEAPPVTIPGAGVNVIIATLNKLLSALGLPLVSEGITLPGGIPVTLPGGLTVPDVTVPSLPVSVPGGVSVPGVGIRKKRQFDFVTLPEAFTFPEGAPGPTVVPLPSATAPGGVSVPGVSLPGGVTLPQVTLPGGSIIPENLLSLIVDLINKILVLIGLPPIQPLPITGAPLPVGGPLRAKRSEMGF